MVFKVGGCLSIAFCIAVIPLAHARHSKKPISADVRFLADSTIVRSEYGQSEDIYLVSLRARHSQEFILARLIDGYPPSRAPISMEVLTSNQTTAFHVRRDPLCDIEYGDMILRTRPGDMLAILPERLGFKPTLPNAEETDEVLPCYRVVRK